MFPFWDVALQPILQAIGARRIVEIGALAGDNTEQLLSALPADAELHVIDPLPKFDPDDHRQRFGGRYVFHRDLSLNVLSTLPPMDAALIDGDHNWYTVYNEVKQLAEVTEVAGAPLPVLLLHDTLWPYGRRDLYYNPDTIPEAERQPWKRQGIRPTSKGLARNGGLNPTLANAVEEGGERNGVMTGLEDALAEYPHPVRKIDIPVYFGLTIVVDERTLAANAELAAVIDHLESREGRYEIMEMIESVRLRSTIAQHNSHYKTQDRISLAADRYLGLLRSSLLNRHYLENELRMTYLADRIAKGLAVDEQNLRDPARYQQDKFRALQAERRGDLPVPTGSLAGSGSAWFPFAGSAQQLGRLHDALELMLEEHVRGDLVDVGIGRGGNAMYMRGFLSAHEVDDRRVWAVDHFRAEAVEDAISPDLNQVREAFESFD
ncbi:MAG: hypothetical protein HKN26_01090, partial [Acidimicrobiales bacterium]|nr:hypothetical protein [Acidimicrobiales bacterium]